MSKFRPPWSDFLERSCIAELAHRYGHFGSLAELVLVDINSEPVLDAYAEIDAWCIQNGLVLGKNDLWIAATAAVTEAEVVTVDKDFEPLHEKFLYRAYYDPDASYPSPRGA